MLVDDVKLDLVSRTHRARPCQPYFSNYDKAADWHLVPAWFDGCEVLAALRAAGDAPPVCVNELTLLDGGSAAIRNFRYVPYVTRDAAIELSAG